ncbi:MAG TPA: hypothetical protein VF507_09125 [Pyrinomonadaceae bacterium]
MKNVAHRQPAAGNRAGSLTRHWPVFAALALYFAVTLTLLHLSTARNGGRLVYALDDAYIHMAMAKNFAAHGVWGVTRHGFSASTSSVLWTLLLSAVYYATGARGATPLVLNILFGAAFVVAFHFILRRFSPAPGYSFLLLLCAIFFTPLPAVVFVGMEHALQVFIVIIFVYVAAGALARDDDDFKGGAKIGALLLAPLVTAIRYEGLFLISVVCLLFLLRRRISYALALGAAAVAPLAIFGLVSVARGAYWLPNSVLLKGADVRQGPLSLLVHAFSQMKAAPFLTLLVLLASGLYLVRRKRGEGSWEHVQILLAVFVFTTLLHVTFSLVLVWFYRYEAYLVALGVLACGVALGEGLISESLRGKGLASTIAGAALSLVLLAASAALVHRGVVSLAQIPRATGNIYRQQYQVARFLHDYYDGQAVAANDVGAINFYADIECLDLWGLATDEVARAKRGGRYDARLIEKLARGRGAKVAVVYDSWLNEYGGAPEGWTPVGRWRIPDNIVCRDDTVTFYAVADSETDRLIQSLAAFSARLPRDMGRAGLFGDFPRYKPGTQVDFRAPESDKYLWYGWSGREPQLRWTDARRAMITFTLERTGDVGTLRLKLSPFLAPGKVAAQRVMLRLNGNLMASWNLTEPAPKIYSAEIPRGVLRERNVLTLELPDAASPALLKLSADARILGVSAEWFEMNLHE